MPPITKKDGGALALVATSGAGTFSSNCTTSSRPLRRISRLNVSPTAMLPKAWVKLTRSCFLRRQCAAAQNSQLRAQD